MARLLVLTLVAALGGGVVGAVVVRAFDDDERATRTAVVTTRVETTIAETRPLTAAATRGGFDAARVYGERAGGVVTLYAVFDGASDSNAHAAQGSGFVVSPQGYVLTNAHVITTAPAADVKPATSVFVEFEDGDRAAARVVGWDLFSDVGVLEVDPSAHELDPVPLGNSSQVAVGEPVAAIGSPFGRQSSLTVGVVSGTRRSISSLTSDFDVVDAIQTDAPINRGNSGGPLFDAAGRVIGINAQIRSDSGVNEGVGFAIPINTARRVMRDLLDGGRVRYAYVGVSTQDLTPSVARRLGYSVSYGALVSCVQDGSPGDRAGLRGGTGDRFVLGREAAEGGDVIVAIDGDRVRSGADLVRIVSEDLRPGSTASFTVVRGEARQTLRITLAERPTRPTGGCRR